VSDAAFDVAPFREHGFVTTPALFDERTLDVVQREIERVWHEEIDRAARSGDAARTGFVRARPELQRLHMRSDALSAFCRAPVLARLALAVTGARDVDRLYNQAYAKGVGRDGRAHIPWHQDGWYAETDKPAFNCWIAITRTTAANGTLRYVAPPVGEALLEHRWDRELEFYRCDVDESAARDVELERGQAFVFSGRVPHASGLNDTALARVAYSISFAEAGVRLAKNGEPFGDRIPVARAGRPVGDWMLEHARGDVRAAPAARALLDELAARVPDGAAQVERRFARFRELVQLDALDRADRELGALLALGPEDVEVMGDLKRARTRIDQLMDEYARADTASKRLLLERMLELEPGNDFAARELARRS
jgi:ectoine hydroxylase-related dioxygenase (phytanoyl-CoA dioxygenase family)